MINRTLLQIGCLVAGLVLGYVISQLLPLDMLLGLIIPILIFIVIGLQFEIIKVNREIKDMAVKNDEKTES